MASVTRSQRLFCEPNENRSKDYYTPSLNLLLAVRTAHSIDSDDRVKEAASEAASICDS